MALISSSALKDVPPFSPGSEPAKKGVPALEIEVVCDSNAAVPEIAEVCDPGGVGAFSPLLW